MAKRWLYQSDAHIVRVIPPPTPPDWGMFSAMSQPAAISPPRRAPYIPITDMSLGIVEQAITFSKGLLFDVGVEPRHKINANEFGVKPSYLIQVIGTSPG